MDAKNGTQQTNGTWRSKAPLMETLDPNELRGSHRYSKRPKNRGDYWEQATAKKQAESQNQMSILTDRSNHQVEQPRDDFWDDEPVQPKKQLDIGGLGDDVYA